MLETLARYPMASFVFSLFFNVSLLYSLLFSRHKSPSINSDALHSHVNEIITCRSTFRFVFRNQFVRFGLWSLKIDLIGFYFGRFFSVDSISKMMMFRYEFVIRLTGSNGTQSNE